MSESGGQRAAQALQLTLLNPLCRSFARASCAVFICAEDVHCRQRYAQESEPGEHFVDGADDDGGVLGKERLDSDREGVEVQLQVVVQECRQCRPHDLVDLDVAVAELKLFDLFVKLCEPFAIGDRQVVVGKGVARQYEPTAYGAVEGELALDSVRQYVRSVQLYVH